LDDFVFQCGDRERTLTTVRLRYVWPAPGLDDTRLS
jgi:hypothetical protein